jgi:predicted metal-dependent phosphoesterase TrpH
MWATQLRGVGRKFALFATFVGLLTPAFSLAQALQRKPTYVLQGSIDRRDHETYRLLPFRVVPGTRRISIEFTYTGHEDKTVIDLGLFDTERFRGWSGGDKSTLTISATDATPSYLPGPLPAGEWHLILGVPNVRTNVHSRYTAKIFLSPSSEPAPVVLRDAAGWYQGDLHSHTAQSDGFCPSLSGKRVPCPEFKLAEAAAARKLDFIAFTDHNTTSTYNALAQWQPYFDTLLLVRGREITTFGGHANVYGTSEFVDFRLGEQGPTPNSLLAEAHRLGAIVSLNHPAAPSGEACMGCGWRWAPQTDFAQVDAIEVINGPDVETVYSGIPFWQERLNAGFRITAIGGSDDHSSGTAGRNTVGMPTTVVYARQLSEPAILEGVRAGHVFIKTQGPHGPNIFFRGECAGHRVMMGDRITAAPGQQLRFTADMNGSGAERIEVVEDGKVTLPVGRFQAGAYEFAVQPDGKRHWYRINVRSSDGKLLVLTNPIYVNFTN